MENENMEINNKAKRAWLRSVPAKVTAFVLVIVLLMSTIACGLLSFLAYMYFIVPPTPIPYEDTDFAWRITNDNANAIYASWPERLDLQNGPWAAGQTNLVFTINSTENANFQEVLDVTPVNAILAQNAPVPEGVNAKHFSFGGIAVIGYLSEPLLVKDNYYASYLLYSWLSRNVMNIIGSFLLTGLASLLLIVFLLRVAGREPDTETVKLRFLDKIPLDIYAAISLLGIVAATIFAIISFQEFRLYTFPGVEYWLPTVSLSLCALVLALGLLMTLATRLKAGTFWRNSLIFIVLAPLCRLLKKLVLAVWELLNNLPLIWPALLSFCVLAIVNFFSTVFVYRQSEMLIIVFLLHLAMFLGVGFIALQLQRLKKAGEELAVGQYTQEINQKWMPGPLKRHAHNLGAIAGGMSLEVDRRLRSERLKTELITNVSHDLKTPLTSLINYVDLLQKEELPQPAAEYAEVAAKHALRLKKLTEDLLEAAKVASGDVRTEKVPVNLHELCLQAEGEFAEKMSQANLQLILNLPEKEVWVTADGGHLWRVLDNLLDNAVKYAQPGTRVYLDVKSTGETAALSVKNISRDCLNVNAAELLERFARGDESRTTEGSGLGLNIAQSLITLQGGVFELTVDGDLFKVDIHF
jgi:signal transduction histidine kinase